MNITLIFEHPDFYVVDKPEGVGFHDEDVAMANKQGTDGTDIKEKQMGFFNLCAAHFSETLFPVHRLDKLTSGLLILARNKKAAIWFQQAFENKQIQKYYLALSIGKPKKKQGSIIGDMAKARLSQWKLIKTKENPSITRFFNWGLTSPSTTGLRLFLVKPETGKTHQIRVALKSLGSAILGDKLYGGQDSDRGYLHALMLNFSYGEQEIKLMSFPSSGALFVDNKNLISELVQQPELHNWPSK